MTENEHLVCTLQKCREAFQQWLDDALPDNKTAVRISVRSHCKSAAEFVMGYLSSNIRDEAFLQAFRDDTLAAFKPVKEWYDADGELEWVPEMLKDFVQDLQDDREINLSLMRLYRAVRDNDSSAIHEAMERCNKVISEQEGRRHE